MIAKKPSTTSDATEGRSEKTQKSKPLKPLPTERIAFQKQLDLLRGYAAASGPTGKPVTNEDVAKIVNMTAGTVSMANSFFADVGFLQKKDGGTVPAQEVVAFQRAYDWNPEKASHKLAPLVVESWFAKALLPKLAFRPLDESEAIADLGEPVSASTEYRSQLRLLLDYLEAAGLIEHDGSQIRLTKPITQAATPPVERAPAVHDRTEPSEKAKVAITTAFVQPTEGVVQFHVSVKVDMAEFAGWSPDRISSFFSGIAQVLAAKGAIEKGASSE